MKNILFLLSCFYLNSCTSDSPPCQYERLKEYNGRYEYSNGATLEMGVSTSDTILYAILDDVKYPLSFLTKDTFENIGGQKVIFKRDKNEALTGYTEGLKEDQPLYKLITKEVSFTDKSWSPRLGQDNKKYTYSLPIDQGDGLQVDHLKNTPLEEERVHRMINDIIEEKVKNIHSILILYKGKLVLEEYFYEYDESTPHQMRSATKSYISLLTGIALDNGLIKNVDQKVYPYFPEYKDLATSSDEKQNISIKHLLTQTAGWDCDDWNESSQGNESKIYKTDDWIKTTLELPILYPPGSKPQYCSNGVLTMGRIIEKASKLDLGSFAKENLFSKLGITNYKWPFILKKSNANTFAQLYLRPRDVAKFMLMINNDGIWNGEQIVSQDWVQKSTGFEVTLDNTEYGYLWWRPYLNVNATKFDALLATGNGGQKAYIWKDIDLITIFNGGNYNQDSKVKDLLVDYILPSFVKEEG